MSTAVPLAGLAVLVNVQVGIGRHAEEVNVRSPTVAIAWL